MKRYLILATALLLLGCRNNNPPSHAEMGYVPNDLEELRKSPDYVSLSEYDFPEEDRNAMIAPAERDPEEDDDALVHFRYSQPINGYTVTIDWQSGTEEAELNFTKGGTSFSVMSYSFDPQMFDYPTDGTHIQLRYKPKPQGRMLYDKEPFFFSDVDFDGTNELLVQEPLAGTRGTNLYHVYELDGSERTDKPLDALCDMTTFNASEKSITQEEYYGVILGSNYLKYRRQRDGSFALTDSTHIDYKVDFTDSIRVHYRKQGDKMILAKKEIL